MVKKLRPRSSLQELSCSNANDDVREEREESAARGPEEINDLFSENIDGDPLMEWFSVGAVTLPE
jgi:hypothetical protein